MEKVCPGPPPGPGEAQERPWVPCRLACGLLKELLKILCLPPQGADSRPEQADVEAESPQPPPAQPGTVLPSLMADPAPPHD